MREQVGVKDEKGGFDPAFSHDVSLEIFAVEPFFDPPPEVFEGGFVEELVFIVLDLLKSPGVIFLQVVEHQGVGVGEEFFEVFYGQEDLVCRLLLEKKKKSQHSLVIEDT